MDRLRDGPFRYCQGDEPPVMEECISVDDFSTFTPIVLGAM